MRTHFIRSHFGLSPPALTTTFPTNPLPWGEVEKRSLEREGGGRATQWLHTSSVCLLGSSRKPCHLPWHYNPHATPFARSQCRTSFAGRKDPFLPSNLPNQPSFLPRHPKSRADATMGFLRSVALPRVHVLTPEHTTGHQELSAGRLSPRSIRPSLLITPSISEVSRGCSGWCLEKGPKGNTDQSGQATHQPLKVPHSYVSTLFCFVCGQARLLGTLSVSRGLGDHQLKVIDTNIEVKPFLSCIPKVSHGTWELQDGIKQAAPPL